MGKGPVSHYHDTVPFAKNNFAKAAKSAASKCNIERHPLLETASRKLFDPPGVARLAMAYPTLRSSTFRSAPLGSSGDQGPLCSICPYMARRLSIDPTQPKNPSS